MAPDEEVEGEEVSIHQSLPQMGIPSSWEIWLQGLDLENKAKAAKLLQGLVEIEIDAAVKRKRLEEVVCPECGRRNRLGPVVSGTEMHYNREAKCACGLTIVVPFIRGLLAAEKSSLPKRK